VIFQCEMNSAENRVIEVENSICDEKHDIIAIFQFAKKHRDQLVASDIRLRALFQIHVCFVQKNESMLSFSLHSVVISEDAKNYC